MSCGDRSQRKWASAGRRARFRWSTSIREWQKTKRTGRQKRLRASYGEKNNAGSEAVLAGSPHAGAVAAGICLADESRGCEAGNGRRPYGPGMRGAGGAIAPCALLSPGDRGRNHYASGEGGGGAAAQFYRRLPKAQDRRSCRAYFSVDRKSW